jgi:NAD(P)-dependent dehydrogenase (short-subunit alcohol dehydrogenase family)
LNGTIHTVVADVKNIQDIQNVAQSAVGKFGNIDTWVHVAGHWMNAPFVDTTEQDLQQMMDINFYGPCK